MLNKSVLALMLSFSMVISPLPIGGYGAEALGGLSVPGAGPSIVLTDETVSPGDAETDASTQEDVSPENPDVSQGDVLPQEPENPENADAPQGDVLPQEPENPENADAPQEWGNQISVFSEAAAQNVISESFEGADIGTWGMTAESKTTLAVVEDSENAGNHYLQLVTTEAARTIPKSLFDEAAPEMKSAVISFKWYTTSFSSTSNSGYVGICIKDGDNEIVTLYVNDIRQPGKGQTTTPLYYTVNGASEKVQTQKTIDTNTVHDVVLDINFETHKLEVKMDNEVVASDVAFNPLTKTVEGFAFKTEGTKPSANIGIDDFLLEYSTYSGSISEDFEGADIGTWGMTAESKTTLAVVEDSENAGNHYLQLVTTEAARTIPKSLFDEAAPEMKSAVISFKWYTTSFSSTSNSGYVGICIKDGDNEIVTLYVNDIRQPGKGQTTTPLYYTVNGASEKVQTQKTIDTNTVHDVVLDINFETHKLEVKMDNEVVASDVAFNPLTKTVEGFAFKTEGTKPSANIGIDDFLLEYTEGSMDVAPSIFKLAELPNIGLTQTEYQAGYAHPAAVEASLLTGDKIQVPIKSDTWVSTPAFDGNSKGIYTWEAEIDPPAENENVNGLKATYQMSYDVLRQVTEADGTVVVNTDFENESDVKWGMEGSLASKIGIVDDNMWIGNKLLQFSSDGSAPIGNVSAKKSFADLPKMSTAKIEFEWYVGTLTSTSNLVYQGISFMSGENELFSLYNNDMRSDTASADLYYSVGGFDNKKATGTKISPNNTYNVEIAFDFSAHTVTMKLDGAEIVSDSILEILRKTDGFSIAAVDTGSGNKLTTTMTIDDFFFAYVEDTSTSEEKVTIYSLDALPTVTVTQEEWEAGTYKHPATVAAMLTSGDKIDVEIDADSWTCAGFDPGKKAAYTWTADIIAPAENENTKKLKASYTMEYHAAMTEEHDYYNDFTFSSEICPSTAWGNLDQTSGTGYLTLSHKTEDNGNGYMFASVTDAGGGRGTRMDFSANAVKGAEISFDWMPVTAAPAGIGSGNIDFFSASNRQNYFTLRFDSDYKITYFTKGDYNNTTVQPEFDGSISEDDRVDTGLGGQNKWFTVKLVFDYYAHTAKLEIAERDDPSKSYTAEVPIEASANGLSTLVMRLDRTANEGSAAEMGLDNVVLDYTPFDSDWIVGVKNPANVNVARSLWDQFTFPETVEATLGNNTKTQVPVGEWTADPAFDLETSPAGEYVWTAQLVPGELKNVFGYSVSFTMTYTSYPFPAYVYNPNTLELSFGEELPAEFPKEVNAKMSDGSMGKAAVGEWTAIREFNAGEEGIYVYGADIVPVDGVYDIVRDKLSPNENPDAPRDDKDKYIYDVYYRISYTKDTDNYNGYVRTMENLDRGVYAVAVNGGVFVSWRLLADEYGADKDISFDVYRGSTKVNAAPITNKTNLVDASGKAGDVYTVVKTQAGVTYEGARATASGQNYMSISVQKPDPQPAKDGNLAAYTLNDMGVADVDGDGEYEFIVKWYPDNAFDSGMANGPSSPTIFDLYELDGTPLWRLNLGLEMPSGAHFNQFMLYDLDEDGKAELFIKTSDGTISYKPNAEGRFDMSDESTIVSYVGDRSVKPGTNIEANGHVNKNSNEYVTVFNGLTGEVIDSIAYENTTGEFTDWGTSGGGKNDGGNRSARYNIAIAYLPKAADSTETIPAVLLNRGYYAKTTVIAYTLRDGRLQKEWNFVRQTGENEAGKGNHNMSTGDIDKDGFDELIIGALAIDHDGSVLWVKDGKEGQDMSGHADTIHLAAMNPDSNDLYVFTPNEDKEISTMNAALVNARTGARIGGSWFTLKDVGRAIAANITPTPGYEYWSASTGSGIYAFDGSIISGNIPVSMNWRMYWDGDLLSELGDGIATDDDWAVTKYDWVDNKVDTLMVMEGTKTNNSTKKTPCLTADLFGDWREEVVLRNEDDTEIRVYMTTEETDYMIYTLMHDPVYRNAVANQNTAYNQPPHVGFYLGEDNRESVLAMELPTARIKYGTPREEKAYDYAVEKKEVPEPSEELKQKLSEQGIVCNTAEELKDYLAKDAASKLQSDFNVEISNTNTVVWEIAVKVKIMQGGQVVDEEDATAENFPTGGIKILLDYPEGTNGTDYNFVVRHLITMCPQDKVGEVVDETFTKTEQGLELLITGASPFAIGWYRVGSESTPSPEPEETPEPGQTPQPGETPKPGQTPQPGETPEPGRTPQPEETPKPIPSSQPDEDDGDDEDDSIQNTSEEQVSAPVKTGDHMGNILAMCMAFIVVSGMGIGVTMYIRYRRKK